MSEKARPSDLTVLVFKDQLTSRTFQIPLSWFSGMGFLLSFAVLVAIIASALAIRSSFLAAGSSPSRVAELERQVQDLKQETLKTASAPSGDLSEANPPPTPEAVVGGEASLRIFPEKIRLTPAAASPVQISDLRVSWGKNGMDLKFNLTYVRNDGGNQQGRILILAKSSLGFFTHPATAMGTGTEGALLSPDGGEFFSVSRYRESKADFPQIKSKVGLVGIDILIFNLSGELLALRPLNKQELSMTLTPPTQQPTQQTPPQEAPHAPGP